MTVAVCDQVEDAADKKGGLIKRFFFFVVYCQVAILGGYFLFSREVVRVVTPGTVIEERLLNPRRNNFLASLFSPHSLSSSSPPETQLHLAWLDISTGHFFISTTGIPSTFSCCFSFF